MASNVITNLGYRVISSVCETEYFVVYRALTEENLHVLLKVPSSSRPSPSVIHQLEHEYDVSLELDPEFVVRSLRIERHAGNVVLILEDFSCHTLAESLKTPLDLCRFFKIATGITAALAAIHRCGLVHKDIKPENVFLDGDGLNGAIQVKLTGFGIASRLSRERQAPKPPEVIAGTLPYMAPEQTGRMNRSIDSRSDLYSLGVILYEMLTGELPFTACDPMQWVHCHIALQPLPPSQRVATIPERLSAIVMKLLAKTAEERYQTAEGLKVDLEHCLSEWQASGRIEPFPLGARDIADRLCIPEKLYGREREIETLLAAFDRVVASGKPELVLVSGYSGMGKSTVVNELHKVLVPPRGLFASGKFDQYKRDIPYTTLAQALQALVRLVLGKSEEEIAKWRLCLREAVGPNGQLVANLVPDLVLLIGEQPPVPEAPPRDAQNRFNSVFRRFLGVFARPEHPLALFLDDLQWLDTATLQFLEYLVIHPDVKHLLVLGAYRDNEVSATHPLMVALDAIRKSGASVQSLVLAPLTFDDVLRLIEDAFRCEWERAKPLARLVYEKTGGNPFFTIQFLTALSEEGLVAFDCSAASWHWDLDRIRGKGFTDNVADLMAGKVNRLSGSSREGLKQLSCLGTKARIATLAKVQGVTEDEVRQNLWEAIQSELVFHDGDTLIFLHDRVQEAAYALIPEQDRAAVHLRIGRMLLAQTEPEDLAETIFDVVDHLNRGAALITDPAGRVQLAELNAAAGRRARASIAYVAARNFFAAAVALLSGTWDSRYDFKFALFLDWAECEYLRGAFEEAEALFEVLLTHAKSDIHQAAVYQLRLKVYQVAGKYDDAVSMGLKALHLFGVEIPADGEALNQETQAEAEAVKVNLRGRQIPELAGAAETADPRVKATIDLLSNVAPAAYIGSKPQLYPFIILKLVNYSLKFGPTKESCHGYSAYGFLLAALFGDPHSGYAFSEMSIKLSERFADRSLRGAVLHLHGAHVNFWVNPIATDFPFLEEAFSACLDVGNHVFASYTSSQIGWQAIERGDTLRDCLNFSQKYADFAQSSRNDAVYLTIFLQQQFMKCLMGETAGNTSLSNEGQNELLCVEKIAAAKFTFGLVCYHTMKLMAAYLMGDDASSRAHAEEAGKMLPAILALPMESTFYFFYALVLTRACRETAASERDEILKTLTAYQKKLDFWAKNCPANFLSKHALVSAEIAEIRGDELSAERLFEQAIESSKENGFIHWEAMAHESAARFHGTRGLKNIAKGYLQEARSCYARWGAEAKVKQLCALHPWLLERSSAEPKTVAAALEQLDVTAIAKAQRAISGEMVRERLAETLLRIVLENAGAQKGYLFVEPGSKLFAVVGPGGQVEFYQAPPESFPGVATLILNYVKRTCQTVILADASSDAGDFSTDDHLLQTKPKSVLCLPILRQAKPIGVLYLENNLAAGAFTADRRTVLEMLASQAAISLENASVYETSRENEAKYRRIVDTATEGIWVLGPHATTTFVNARMAEMLGYSGGEMIGRPVTDFMYKEDAPEHLRKMEDRRQGLSDNYERRFRHKDGQTVWTLASATPILDDAHRFNGSLAMFTDITERKRAAEAIRLKADQYATMLTASADGFWLLDLDGKIRDINDAYCRMSGYSRDELLALGVPDIEVKESAADIANHIQKVVQTGYDHFETRHRKKDGEVWDLEISSAYWRATSQLILFMHDITERKQSEAEILKLNRELELRVAQRTAALESANKELEAFTYSASHDLRAPLRAIDGFARILLEDYKGALDAAGQRYLDLVSQGAVRMGRLIDDLLAFSRMSRSEIGMETVDMTAMAREVFVELRAAVPDRNISFVLGDLPPANCDRAMIRQVVTNLLGNAIKYTGPRPETVIEVSGMAGEAENVYCVRDNGVGFDMRYAEKLFGVFQRLHSAEEFEGTGIGLAIVKRIVERHGGRVWAESKLDEGAMVYFTIPSGKELPL